MMSWPVFEINADTLQVTRSRPWSALRYPLTSATHPLRVLSTRDFYYATRDVQGEQRSTCGKPPCPPLRVRRCWSWHLGFATSFTNINNHFTSGHRHMSRQIVNVGVHFMFLKSLVRVKPPHKLQPDNITANAKPNTPEKPLGQCNGEAGAKTRFCSVR